MTTFYTIGHSTHDLEEFVKLLQAHGVDCLVDVRSYPGSRRCPQFNKETLPADLASYGIDYVHLADLGGRRRKNLDVDPSVNDLWTHIAFKNYADYTLTPAFEHGLAALRELGQTRTVAYMCSEALWWRCHRRIITDYLLAKGEDVQHILANGKLAPASVTQGATCDHGHVSYRK